MKVRKRDGRKINFDEKKIEDAIKLASYNMKSDNKITDEQLKNVMSYIKKSLDKKDSDFENETIIEVDEIHNLVEKGLNSIKSAKSFKVRLYKKLFILVSYINFSCKLKIVFIFVFKKSK